MDILLNKRIHDTFSEIEIPPRKKIISSMLKVSLPAAAETFLICLIGLLDTIMVSGVGKEALAAVSIAQQPVFIALVVCMGLNAGVTAIVSRRYGEGKQEEAKKTLRQSIILGAIASVILAALFMLLARPLLWVTGAKADTIDYSAMYFRIVLVSLPFNYIRLIICAGFRATGKTKVTLITNVIANIVNLCLNYCLIMGNFGFPALGVTGAAIATAIGNFVAFIITVLILRFKKSFIQTKLKDGWLLDKGYSKNIINVSANASVEQLFMRLGFYLIAVMINNLGTDATATNAIVSNTISLAFSITDGFAIGASALVGKSLGEKNPPLAFAYGRISQITSFVLGMIMISVVITLRMPICNMFAAQDASSSKEVIESASSILLLAVFVIFPQSLQWVTTNILRGSGDVKFTARTAILSVAIVRPLFTLVCCYVFKWGVLGAWIGTFIDQALRFAINNHRFTHLQWIKIRL